MRLRRHRAGLRATRGAHPGRAPAAILDAVDTALAELDRGSARVAEFRDGRWQVNEWLKKAVLLSFRAATTTRRSTPAIRASTTRCRSSSPTYDAERFARDGVRVVPPARRAPRRVCRAQRRADAVLRQHRRLRRRGHDGRHLGHRRLLRADRQERAPVGRRRHRRRARAAAGRARRSSRTTASSARARRSSRASSSSAVP